jgi:hypothetical protein
MEHTLSEEIRRHLDSLAPTAEESIETRLGNMEPVNDFIRP